MEQEPGPRGSPQLPQGPGAEGRDADGPADDPLAETAKTDSLGLSFLLWHFGHSAFWEP